MNNQNYFINFSNHPSAAWSAEQRNAAEEIGQIVDIAFPNVNPMMTTEEVQELAKQCCEKIFDYGTPTVMCQGEFCLSYTVVSELKAAGCRVVAACSNREVIEEKAENGESKKTVVFRFVQFREY